MSVISLSRHRQSILIDKLDRLGRLLHSNQDSRWLGSPSYSHHSLNLDKSSNDVIVIFVISDIITLPDWIIISKEMTSIVFVTGESHVQQIG